MLYGDHTVTLQWHSTQPALCCVLHNTLGYAAVAKCNKKEHMHSATTVMPLCAIACFLRSPIRWKISWPKPCSQLTLCMSQSHTKLHIVHYYITKLKTILLLCADITIRFLIYSLRHTSAARRLIVDPVVDRSSQLSWSKISQVESIEKSSTSRSSRVEFFHWSSRSICSRLIKLKILKTHAYLCAESVKWPDGRNDGHTSMSVISAICRSGYFQQPTQPRRLCTLSFHVDSTTATHCCTILPTHYSGGCSQRYRTLLPAWLRVHGDGITLLRFWGTSVGCQFGVVSTIS